MSDGVSRGNIFKRLANKLKRKFKRWQSEPTTSDWRSLSPNQPPLPFLTPEYRLRDSVNDKKLREERSVLFPILEESEIMTEEVIQAPFDDSNLPSTPDSNLPSNIDSNLPSNIDSNIENLPSNTQFICSNDTTPLDDKSNVPPTTSSQTPSDITLDSQPSSDHSQPHSWHYTPSDKYFSDTLIGDELLCKKKFAKMIVKLMTNTHDNRPSHMDLTFDEDGNIDNVHIIRNYRSEYHKFCGQSQYIPPEFSVQTEYNPELTDIWILGIFLYRMLTGHYPFSAPNDHLIFRKMLTATFHIPASFSKDLKDLLKLMLAPVQNRASLDLIIYHPWLKEYRSLLHPPQPPPVMPKVTRSTPKHRSGQFIIKAAKVLFKGPFPPPKHIYQDLGHLGTRESVFARQRHHL